MPFHAYGTVDYHLNLTDLAMSGFVKAGFGLMDACFLQGRKEWLKRGWI